MPVADPTLTHRAEDGPTIVTSPSSLGLEDSPSRVKRLSQRMEKTVDKLGRSIGGKSPSPSGSPRNRMFSIKRKGRTSSPDNLSQSAQSDTPQASRPASPKPSTDDSPFITPPEPLLHPVRPSFRGDGSMRAGTQTLIQALQAIPWENDPEEALDSESEDEHKSDSSDRLASSIHTIYRPVARSRQRSNLHVLHQDVSPSIPEPVRTESPQGLSESEDDADDEDFERDATPRISQQPYMSPVPVHSPGPIESSSTVTAGKVTPFNPPSFGRAGSMATVRLQKRARLAEKLKGIFEIEDIEEVWSEMPCWLLRSVLLQGYMYLTNSYLCFFAHLPARENQILKSGSLSKRTNRTKRWIKHWFILKNDALSWYQSSSDPYFPHGIVDLRYTISCEPSGEKEIRLRTNQRTVLLSADSVPSREEWVKAIRKVIFKAQNSGDSVKIAIPYSAILDVEKSAAIDFSDTIEVKVVDKEDSFSVDSYFFAYFQDIASALEQIREAVRSVRNLPDQNIPHAVLDTTVPRPPAHPTVDRPMSSPPQESNHSRSTSAFRLGNFLRPFSSTALPASASSPPEEEFTHISKRTDSSSFVPMTSSPPGTPGSEETAHQAAAEMPHPHREKATIEHTYPPSSFVSSAVPSNHASLHRESGGLSTGSSAWSVSVPSWLKSGRLLGSGSSSGSGVKEIYSVSPPPSHLPASTSRFGGLGDLTFSILETPDTIVDSEVQDKFRSTFAYDEKETLLGYFPGYIFRLLPISGKLYISTNYFCFKSSGPLTMRTKMTLPLGEILAIEKSKATRLGYHGLVVVIKGHEELFFEFWAEDRRNSLVELLERQIEDVRRRLAVGESDAVSSGKQDALILEEFGHRSVISPPVEPAPAPDVVENLSDSLPAVMFTSASSTFLTFKPKNSMHFTFLTIGSRGDVQPYIALAKGLLADGHRVRIATHAEFKEWIESHGIEYGYVGGDPAELMRICVENGLFTVSFLKETLQKFRGWLDDLLKTSWEACQGTDVLVESPSAMGGLHIAEALGIPYFRAFTMTWTRTRAYPHAFAVPDRKMGGGYNYMSYVMFDQVFWRAIQGQINRWRRNMLHVGSTGLDKMEPHKVPFLYNFSPHVVPPPLDWPEWIRVTGYWFLNDAEVSAKQWTPPDSLVQFISDAEKIGKKIVYIGFGSIVVSDPKAMTRAVIDSVLKSDVMAILSKGWSDRLHVKTSDAAEPEEPLPEQIYPITSIPHDWLFQRIHAACHHGGAGTTGASLRAGIPTIIHPFFGDQFFWSDRVEALGVGSGVRKMTVDTLTEALVTATTDRKQIDRARLLGEQIRAEDGVATAIEAIYRDLEYARSIIKRRREERSTTDEEFENSTVRDQDMPNQYSLEPRSGYSSSGSARGGGAPSEDWSVISDQDEPRSPVDSSHIDDEIPEVSKKRRSLASAFTSLASGSIST